jgi:hypothetical protein
MNDYIKDLWTKADGHYDAGNQHTYPQYTIDNPEKFAGLMMQECIDWLYFHGESEAAERLEWRRTNLGIK